MLSKCVIRPLSCGKMVDNCRIFPDIKGAKMTKNMTEDIFFCGMPHFVVLNLRCASGCGYIILLQCVICHHLVVWTRVVHQGVETNPDACWKLPYRTEVTVFVFKESQPISHRNLVSFWHKHDKRCICCIFFKDCKNLMWQSYKLEYVVIIHNFTKNQGIYMRILVFII